MSTFWSRAVLLGSVWVANSVVSLALHSTACNIYKSGITIVGALCAQMLMISLFCYICSKTRVMPSQFPNVRLDLSLFKRFWWAGSFMFLVVVSKEVIRNMVGISKTELISSLAMPGVAVLSYFFLNKKPSPMGAVCCILAILSGISTLTDGSIRLWISALLSASLVAGRTIAYKYADMKGDEVPAGTQLLVTSLIGFLLAAIYVVVYQLFILAPGEHGLMAGVFTHYATGIYFLDYKMTYLCILAFVSNFLTIILLKNLSPVAYHIQSFTKSVILSLYDLSDIWLYYPGWLIALIPAGTPENMESRGNKISLALKLLGTVLYIAERVYISMKEEKKKKTEPQEPITTRYQTIDRLIELEKSDITKTKTENTEFRRLAGIDTGYKSINNAKQGEIDN